MGKIRYLVHVKTSDAKKSGTNEDVWCQLVGTDGETGVFGFDDGARDDFEQGDYDVYPMLDDDIGELKHILFSLTAEGKFSGEVSLNVAAEFKALSGAVGLAEVEKWGSGHNSPMWKIDHAKVFCYRIGTEHLGAEAAFRSATFSADRWLAPGQIVKISNDVMPLTPLKPTTPVKPSQGFSTRDIIKDAFD